MKLCSKLIVVLFVLLLVFLVGCSANEKAMVEAVKKGDTVKVQSLLDKGVSPNLKTEDGKTILMLATYLGHLEVTQLLIEKGADVNAQDNEGKTALMYAAEKGNIAMAQLLLENGADLNAVDKNGKTALQIAQENNQTEMVEFLSNWGKAKSASEPLATQTIEPTPSPQPVNEPTPTAEVVSIDQNTNEQLASIFFNYDQALLRSDQTGTLEEILGIVSENPDMYIILGGHADERGSREYNLVLSERRVKAVQKYLTDNGISSTQIVIYAYGKDYPLEKAHNESSWSANRRVDIIKWDTVLTKEQLIAETVK